MASGFVPSSNGKSESTHEYGIIFHGCIGFSLSGSLHAYEPEAGAALVGGAVKAAGSPSGFMNPSFARRIYLNSLPF